MSGHVYIFSFWRGSKIVTVNPVTFLRVGHGVWLTFGTARFHSFAAVQAYLKGIKSKLYITLNRKDTAHSRPGSNRFDGQDKSLNLSCPPVRNRHGPDILSKCVTFFPACECVGCKFLITLQGFNFSCKKMIYI